MPLLLFPGVDSRLFHKNKIICVMLDLIYFSITDHSKSIYFLKGRGAKRRTKTNKGEGGLFKE